MHAAGFTSIAAAAARELISQLDQPSRIVDIGCGDGTSAAALTASGHEVIGIDTSPAFVDMARARVPGARFEVASFVDFDMPLDQDAILAVGEVLGYRLDARNDDATLAAVLARAARALRPGGALLFDLAGPGRVPGGHTQGWRDEDGWAVLVDAREDGAEVTRRIVTFLRAESGCFERSEEVHRLLLHEPGDVERRLQASGFSVEMVKPAYAGEALPPAVTAFFARRR